jgi:hypothetical protein
MTVQPLPQEGEGRVRYRVSWKQRAREAEDVLRELLANSASDGPGDPDFRHWAAVTILSYFSAQGVEVKDG